jgi:exodeoxyribonuclease V alpha subunit
MEIDFTLTTAADNRNKTKNDVTTDLIDNTVNDNVADEINIKQQYKNFVAEDPNLIKNLRSIGLGEVMIVKIIDYFTLKHTYNILFKKNIYKLMDVEGIGFFKADNCAKSLNYANEDPRRQKALILHVLENNKSFGNVYLNTTILEKEAKKQNVLLFNERLKEMIENKELIIEDNRIYLKKLHVAEVEVADMIKTLIG